MRAALVLFAFLCLFAALCVANDAPATDAAAPTSDAPAHDGSKSLSDGSKEVISMLLSSFDEIPTDNVNTTAKIAEIKAKANAITTDDELEHAMPALLEMIDSMVDEFGSDDGEVLKGLPPADRKAHV